LEVIVRNFLLCLSALLGLFSAATVSTSAQDDESRIKVRVNLVQLNVAVTDKDGNYVTGLLPQDFAIAEDNIPQKIATFEEGGEPPHSASDVAAGAQATVAPAVEAGSMSPAGDSTVKVSPFTDANVFVLFDTSNYMYRGFIFAQDAIAGFVRSLQGASKVALYSYSRNLSRVAPLTADREQVLEGVRSTVAGDSAALYNCLLLTVKDAARVTGRKVIVVFSNGPDDSSVVPPEVVAELAQSTGTVIYMVSTREAETEPISTAVFERMSKATGGKAYFAKNWEDETKAFASIRDDLAHLYSISYYPAPNPNRGWRSVSVKLVGKDKQKYRIRTRDGYRLQQVKVSEEDLTGFGGEDRVQ
jgi:Ca-activated chloride channel family protein